jgi:Ser/Thr protein kinase RdoA (MazF antagonist)
MNVDAGERVRQVLAVRFDEVVVGERLHAVPPHVVHAVTVDGRRAVCKLAVGPEADVVREARVLDHVGRETSLPVPAVLAVGEGHVVAEWLDAVPGEGDLPGEGGRDLADWARVAGAGLATLHEEAPLDAHGPLRAREGGLAVDARGSAAEGLAGYLDDLRPAVTDTGYADILDDAAAFLRTHPDALAGAGDPVLCHGNWLPEHVGVDDGEVTAVIDVERALAAPAEHDYHRAAIPLFGGPGDTDEAAREAFRAGYESVRPLPGGFEERADVHRLAIVATFVESLFVQDEHGPAETERRAGALRAAVDDLVAASSSRS